MSKVISTYGTGEKFITSCLMGLGATQADPNGRLFIDGQMVNVELAQTIIESIYVQDIFQDGLNCTKKFETNTKAGMTRVALATPFPFTSRTLGFAGRRGTSGNGGIVNINAPIMQGEDEIVIYNNQVNDQALFFADLSKEYLPIDVVAKKIYGFTQRVSMDRNGSTLAEVIAYNIFRSMNSGENIMPTGDLDQKGQMANVLNALNTKLDDGDEAMGAFTYATSGRCIIGRPDFVNRIFKLDSGLIVDGGDLAQTMLQKYDLEQKMGERSYVGENYKGMTSQFAFVKAPSAIWSLAEKYLELPKGALDKVEAIAISYDSLACTAVVDLGAKLVDATHARGTLMQPLNIWGHEAFRKGYIIGNLTNDDFVTMGFDGDTRVYPIAPKDLENANANEYIELPITNEAGEIIGYKRVLRVPKPNGGNMASGSGHVADIVADVYGKVTSGTVVHLSTVTEGADIYYTLDGTTPTSKSTKYTSSGITISSNKTIKAIAVKKGLVGSSVFEATYTIS